MTLIQLKRGQEQRVRSIAQLAKSSRRLRVLVGSLLLFFAAESMAQSRVLLPSSNSQSRWSAEIVDNQELFQRPSCLAQISAKEELQASLTIVSPDVNGAFTPPTVHFQNPKSLSQDLDFEKLEISVKVRGQSTTFELLPAGLNAGQSENNSFIAKIDERDRLIQSLVAGSVATARAKASRGQINQWTFSLSGSSKAYRAMKAGCRL